MQLGSQTLSILRTSLSSPQWRTTLHNAESPLLFFHTTAVQLLRRLDGTNSNGLPQQKLHTRVPRCRDPEAMLRAPIVVQRGGGQQELAEFTQAFRLSLGVEHCVPSPQRSSSIVLCSSAEAARRFQLANLEQTSPLSCLDTASNNSKVEVWSVTTAQKLAYLLLMLQMQSVQTALSSEQTWKFEEWLQQDRIADSKRLLFYPLLRWLTVTQPPSHSLFLTTSPAYLPVVEDGCSLLFMGRLFKNFVCHEMLQVWLLHGQHVLPEDKSPGRVPQFIHSPAKMEQGLWLNVMVVILFLYYRNFEQPRQAAALSFFQFIHLVMQLLQAPRHSPPHTSLQTPFFQELEHVLLTGDFENRAFLWSAISRKGFSTRRLAICITMLARLMWKRQTSLAVTAQTPQCVFWDRVQALFLAHVDSKRDCISLSPQEQKYGSALLVPGISSLAVRLMLRPIIWMFAPAAATSTPPLGSLQCQIADYCHENSDMEARCILLLPSESPLMRHKLQIYMTGLAASTGASIDFQAQDRLSIVMALLEPSGELLFAWQISLWFMLQRLDGVMFEELTEEDGPTLDLDLSSDESDSDESEPERSRVLHRDSFRAMLHSRRKLRDPLVFHDLVSKKVAHAQNTREPSFWIQWFLLMASETVYIHKARIKNLMEELQLPIFCTSSLISGNSDESLMSAMAMASSCPTPSADLDNAPFVRYTPSEAAAKGLIALKEEQLEQILQVACSSAQDTLLHSLCHLKPHVPSSKALPIAAFAGPSIRLDFQHATELSAIGALTPEQQARLASLPVDALLQHFGFHVSSEWSDEKHAEKKALFFEQLSTQRVFLPSHTSCDFYRPLHDNQSMFTSSLEQTAPHLVHSWLRRLPRQPDYLRRLHSGFEKYRNHAASASDVGGKSAKKRSIDERQCYRSGSELGSAAAYSASSAAAAPSSAHKKPYVSSSPAEHRTGSSSAAAAAAAAGSSSSYSPLHQAGIAMPAAVAVSSANDYSPTHTQMDYDAAMCPVEMAAQGWSLKQLQQFPEPPPPASAANLDLKKFNRGETSRGK